MSLTKKKKNKMMNPNHAISSFLLFSIVAVKTMLKWLQKNVERWKLHRRFALKHALY